MKFLALTCLLTIMSSVSLAQAFTISELERLTKNNWDEFDTYVTAKGYQYYKSSSTEDYESKSYALEQNVASEKAENFISLYKYVSGSPLFVSSVDFQTLNQKLYLKLKDQARMLGFKYIESKTSDNSTSFIYRKGKNEITFHVIKVVNSIPTYEIDFTLLK